MDEDAANAIADLILDQDPSEEGQQAPTAHKSVHERADATPLDVGDLDEDSPPGDESAG
jgi:hypothetical protein